jgi:hypothetical protein
MPLQGLCKPPVRRVVLINANSVSVIFQLCVIIDIIKAHAQEFNVLCKLDKIFTVFTGIN